MTLLKNFPNGRRQRRASFTDQEIFDEWMILEGADTSWQNGLPKCPLTLCQRDPEIWDEPHEPFNPEKYHPGGVWEIRTLKANSSGAGNQCIYDADQKLITSGDGKGSADRIQAEGAAATIVNFFSDSGHIGHDVSPFDLAYDLDGGGFGSNVRRYLSVRPLIY